MAVKRVNDHDEFIWLSTDEPPIRGSNSIGARGLTLDGPEAGKRWIYDGLGWAEDRSLIYAMQQAVNL